MDVRVGSVVIDCADPPSLAVFWVAVTGYRRESADDDWVSLIDPREYGPRIGLQRVPEPKTVKNRLHLEPVRRGRGGVGPPDRGPRGDPPVGLEGSR